MREYERFRRWLRAQGVLMAPLAALAAGAIPDPQSSAFEAAIRDHGKTRTPRAAPSDDPDAPRLRTNDDAAERALRARPDWMTKGARVVPLSGGRKGKVGIVGATIGDGLIVVTFDPRERLSDVTSFYPGELTQPQQEEEAR